MLVHVTLDNGRGRGTFGLADNAAEAMHVARVQWRRAFGRTRRPRRFAVQAIDTTTGEPTLVGEGRFLGWAEIVSVGSARMKAAG